MVPDVATDTDMAPSPSPTVSSPDTTAVYPPSSSSSAHTPLQNDFAGETSRPPTPLIEPVLRKTRHGIGEHIFNIHARMMLTVI